MQPTPGGGSDGGGGVSRTGLSRFRSAPATWLEALLEDEEEDPLKPNQCLTQLLTENSSSSATARIASVNPFGTSSSSSSPAADLSSFDAAGFLRHNSSPADFLRDGSLSANFGVGPPSFDLAASGNLSSGSKRSRDVEGSTPQHFSSPKLSNPIKMEQGEQVTGLIDLEMEKLLEDSVPLRVRAKRGYATHPRSIAERVRRTRISDRIRKLQELVPNMDKQTNTADMLEEAVEYVKYLQRQIQELSERQRGCKCTGKE